MPPLLETEESVLVFWWRATGTTLSAGPALATGRSPAFRPALTAGAAQVLRATICAGATLTRTSLITRAALTAGTTLALRRAHLFQLRHLVGCQNLLELGLHVGFQISHLLLLVAGEVKLLLGAPGQHVNAAWGWGWWRALTVRSGLAVLGGNEACRCTECQGEDDGFHLVWGSGC